jgi:NitT/TauT family transport system substrate-binding protein
MGIFKKNLGCGVLAVGTALALVLSGCGSGANESSSGSGDGDETITILYSRAIEQVGLWVAQDEGIFAKHGLKVKLSEVAGASQVAVAISGGSAQMGFETGPDFLSAVNAGVKLVVASGLSVDTAENPRVALIAGKDSNISTPADMAGKRIAVPGVNTSAHLSTIRKLEEAGVDVSGIKWVTLPFQQASDALKANRVDAVVSVYPFIGLLKSQGNVPVIAQYAVSGEEQLVVFLSASATWAAAHSDEVKSLRVALDEATSFVTAHPDQTRTIIEKYSHLPADVINKIPFPNLSTEVTPDQLDFFLDIMKKQNLIKDDLDMATLIAK